MKKVKLEYRWKVGNSESSNYQTAPIETPKNELITLMQETDLGGLRWRDRIGLSMEVDGKVRTSDESFLISPNMFLFPEYAPFCMAIARWLDTNTKNGVEWTCKPDLSTYSYSEYVMKVSIALHSPYVSHWVSVGLPKVHVSSEVCWNWYEQDERKKSDRAIPFRGDWVGLAKEVCRRLGKLELMGNIEPPTSLRDLLNG